MVIFNPFRVLFQMQRKCKCVLLQLTIYNWYPLNIIGIGASVFTGNPLIIGMVAISMALGEVNAAMNREAQQRLFSRG